MMMRLFVEALNHRLKSVQTSSGVYAADVRQVHNLELLCDRVSRHSPQSQRVAKGADFASVALGINNQTT